MSWHWLIVRGSTSSCTGLEEWTQEVYWNGGQESSRIQSRLCCASLNQGESCQCVLTLQVSDLIPPHSPIKREAVLVCERWIRHRELSILSEVTQQWLSGVDCSWPWEPVGLVTASMILRLKPASEPSAFLPTPIVPDPGWVWHKPEIVHL